MTEKIAAHAISERSRRNLMKAMRGEAFAFATYKLFARQARSNGNLELAALFDKTADQQYLEYFAEQAELLDLMGSDEQDLTSAITGEFPEVDTLYAHCAEQAHEDGDERVAHRFEEMRHDEAFRQLALQEALIKLQTRERARKNATRRSAKAHDY